MFRIRDALVVSISPDGNAASHRHPRRGEMPAGEIAFTNSRGGKSTSSSGEAPSRLAP